MLSIDKSLNKKDDLTIEEIAEDLWWRVYDRDAGICQRPECDNEGVELHHKIFRSQGGQDDPSNLVLLCRKHHKEGHAERKWRKYWENWQPKKYLDIYL